MVSNEIERIFEQGKAAFVTYRVVTKTGDAFRNTEFFVFEGDRVKASMSISARRITTGRSWRRMKAEI